MNKEVLLELAARWEQDVKKLEEDNSAVEDGPAGERRLGKEQGIRETKRECADTLRTLISLLS